MTTIDLSRIATASADTDDPIRGMRALTFAFLWCACVVLGAVGWWIV